MKYLEEKEVLNCVSCGEILEDDMLYCPECGTQINKEQTKSSVVGEFVKEKNTFEYWVYVLTFVSLCILFMSLIFHKGVLTFLSLIQLGILVLALAIDTYVHKLSHKLNWTKYVLIVLSIFMFIPTTQAYARSRNIKPDEPIVPNKEITRVKIPGRPEKFVDKKVDDVKDMFTKARFTNIKTQLVKDLTASQGDKVGCVKSVLINQSTEYEKGQEVNRDIPVLITYRDFKDCKVNIHINFVENFFWNRYDVHYNFDNQYQTKLLHGQDKDFSYSLRPGEYEITFTSDEDSEVVKSTKIDVSDDMDITYTIYCTSNHIFLTKTHQDQQSQDDY